jgi:hypothetical protein
MKYRALWQAHDFCISKKPKKRQITGVLATLAVSAFFILYAESSTELRLFGIAILLCSYLIFIKIFGLTIQRKMSGNDNPTFSGLGFLFSMVLLLTHAVPIISLVRQFLI